MEYPQQSANLRNVVSYPPLSKLPSRFIVALQRRFLGGLYGHFLVPVPSKHWCFLATIVRFPFIPGVFILDVKDIEGNILPLIFSQSVPSREEIFRKECKIGYTVAVMYPMLELFAGICKGIVVDGREEFKILPFSLDSILKVNDTIFKLPKHEEVEVCQHCKEKSSKLFRCGTCLTVYYCGKSCQVNAWKDGHKLECPLMKELRWFLKKDWRHFDKNLLYRFDT